MRNRYLEAFKENYNVLGLATIVSATAMALSPLPLLVGLVAEVAYLVFVPDSKWYESRLSSRNDADVEKRREELKAKVLPTLRPEMRERFSRLESVRAALDSQNIEGPVSQNATWLREILRKLDFLLEKWLQFAAKEAQFRNYLESVRREVRANDTGLAPRPGGKTHAPGDFDVAEDFSDLNPKRAAQTSQNPQNPNRLRVVPLQSSAQTPAPQTPATGDASERWAKACVAEVQQHYDGELEGVKAERAAESDAATGAVLDKRIDVLERRREFVGKIGRILSNLTHQLRLLEDTFGLISDELRARPPEQVLADIDDVVGQTNTMTQLLEEVAPFENALSRTGTL